MWKWFLMACALFCAINWWLLPQFPRMTQWISPLTIYGAIGLSGLFMLGSLLLGKK